MIPVIVRQYPDGDLIAIYPTEPAATDNPYHCRSVMWCGWGAAAPHVVISQTKPVDDETAREFLRRYDYTADPDEYRIYRRLTARMTEQRVSAWRNYMALDAGISHE